MQEHYIKNIEIKNFKCFENFKAEGFGRVNLIAGKNNVGKTAFMEACYLIQNNPEINLKLKHITRMRYMADILEDLFKEIGKKFINNFIEEKSNTHNNYQITSNIEDSKVNILFKSSNKSTKKNYNEYYGEIIDNELEDKLDDYIKEFDSNITKFRMKESQPFCQKNGKFYNINEFGDGLGKFISLILLVLSSKDNILLIDEIDNGIHYTNLDKLWEIILKISKEQNVQVFATTHSKECIESYARVAKRLEDEEITMTTLARNPKGELKALVWNKRQFFSEIEQNHEVRGW
ncbi:hypothetical protein MNB_SV-13-13 [hydrothermal vent metagenome]|uniref:ATPase AAA-type core domain-containing protein n=1 Tax=hydrothermal vent metagenome TaxID=652676 RepID=A0A1W1C145_9ZZZZ